MTEQPEDDIVRQAELWATGATIHNVKNAIGFFRSLVVIAHKRPSDEATADVAAARQFVADYMSHGDYMKAKRDNPTSYLREYERERAKRQSKPLDNSAAK